MSRTSRGAAAIDSSVTTTSSAVETVTSRRTNAVPPSGSSRSARASTGTKIAVNVASSTSAATRFGSWLATENPLDSAAPRIAARITIRAKPVIRLTRVAKAIPHDRDTSAASDSSGRAGGVVPCDDTSPVGGSGPVGGPGRCGRRRGGPDGRRGGWTGGGTGRPALLIRVLFVDGLVFVGGRCVGGRHVGGIRTIQVSGV